MFGPHLLALTLLTVKGKFNDTTAKAIFVLIRLYVNETHKILVIVCHYITETCKNNNQK